MKVINDLFQPILFRLKNTYLVTFTFSWIVLNWRVLAILFFSEESVEKKINRIENCFWSMDYTLYYPLATTGIVLFIVPIVNLYSELIVSRVRLLSGRFIHREREAAIKNEGLLSLEKLKAEDAQNEYKESKQKGDLISKYEETISVLSHEKNDLQSKMLDQINKSRIEKEELVSKYDALIKNIEKKRSDQDTRDKKTILEIMKNLEVAKSVIRDFILDKGYRSGTFFIQLPDKIGGYYVELSSTELFVRNESETSTNDVAIKNLATLIKASPEGFLHIMRSNRLK